MPSKYASVVLLCLLLTPLTHACLIFQQRPKIERQTLIAIDRTLAILEDDINSAFFAEPLIRPSLIQQLSQTLLTLAYQTGLSPQDLKDHLTTSQKRTIRQALAFIKGKASSDYQIAPSINAIEPNITHTNGWINFLLNLSLRYGPDVFWSYTSTTTHIKANLKHDLPPEIEFVEVVLSSENPTNILLRVDHREKTISAENAGSVLQHSIIGFSDGFMDKMDRFDEFLGAARPTMALADIKARTRGSDPLFLMPIAFSNEPIKAKIFEFFKTVQTRGLKRIANQPRTQFVPHEEIVSLGGWKLKISFLVRFSQPQRFFVMDMNLTN